MMISEVRRPVHVRVALASDESSVVVLGRVSGLKAEDIRVLEATLRDVSTAACFGMFAFEQPWAMTFDAALTAPETFEFTLRMRAQHVSMLRILTNVIRTQFATTTGPPIEIDLSWYSTETGPSRSTGTPLLTIESIDYLSNYDMLSFPVDRGMLASGGDHVVRIYFHGNLSRAEFQRCRDLCHFWDRLLALEAYSDRSSPHDPFLFEDLEVYLVAPDVLEHVVIGLHQSHACFYALCAAFGRSDASRPPIRLVEIE